MSARAAVVGDVFRNINQKIIKTTFVIEGKRHMKCNPRIVVATSVAALFVSVGAMAAEPSTQKGKQLRSIPAHHTVVVRDAETGGMRAANADELAALGLVQEAAPAELAAPMARSARTAAPAAATVEEVPTSSGVAVKLNREFFSNLHAEVNAEGKVVLSHDKNATETKAAPAAKSEEK